MRVEVVLTGVVRLQLLTARQPTHTTYTTSRGAINLFNIWIYDYIIVFERAHYSYLTTACKHHSRRTLLLLLAALLDHCESGYYSHKK